MTRQQLIAVMICIIINTLDGFDVLVIAFAATSLSTEWQLPPEQLGILFSSGLLGMILGAILIAPLADHYGRRRVTLACLCAITIGMFVSAFTQNISQLAVMRLFTGLGIGGMLASLNTLVAEYSPQRLRSFMVSLLQAGYPVGGVIGGIVSVFLIGEFGWRSLFWVGGVMSLVMIPIAFWRLPESADYLFSRRVGDALERGNRERVKLGLQPMAVLPPLTGIESHTGFRQLWGDLPYQTMLLWACFFMVMVSWYFVASWTPKLLVDAGLELKQGISGGVLLSIGAIIGGIVLGFLSIRLDLLKLTRFFMLASVLSLVCFGLFANTLASMMLLAFIIGFFVAGSMIGLYSIAPQIYPPTSRNTGLGWAIGFGRGGAVLGPYLAGVLLSRQFSHGDIYMLFALPMVVAMFSVWMMMSVHRGEVMAEQETT